MSYVMLIPHYPKARFNARLVGFGKIPLMDPLSFEGFKSTKVESFVGKREKKPWFAGDCR